MASRTHGVFKAFGVDDIVLLLVLGKFAIQFAAAGGYGIFRDELYDIDCGLHFDWGDVDQPPLIALVALLSVKLFGLSLYGLRLWPALAGAALVWVAALLARDLGGGKLAQRLAAFAIIPVPIYLALQHLCTMNAFEPLLWTLAAWLAVRMIQRQEPRYWLLIGLVCGIGMENKYTMALPIAALPLALVGASNLRLILNRWFVGGVAVGLLVFLPNLLWLHQHDYPFLEFYRNGRANGSQLHRSPWAFVADQALIMNPLLAPLWGAGLIWTLARRAAAEARFVGGFFLAIFVPLLLLSGKNYYATPAYPVLFAAGAVAFETWSQKSQAWLRTVYVSGVAAVGLAMAPFVLPILPIKDFLAYQSAWGGFRPIITERTAEGVLPQWFADEIGWEDMVKETARLYHSLPAAEQARAAIFANNFGEAAAIDVLGPKYGLPPAIGNDVSYWLWGPRQYHGDIVIVLGSDGAGDREHFRQVEVAGRVENPLSRPNEQFDIFLCRGLTIDLQIFWPSIKRWGT
jgi:Dolichyl-phosphate-mannose-protein mannosyltransferase